MEYYDKRKIYLTETVYNRLKNDAQQFEILKKDNHTVNMNLFLSKLLTGYYDDYSKEYHLTRTSLMKALDILPQDRSLEIANNILKEIIYAPSEIESSPKNKSLSLKPTKETIILIEQIEKEIGISDSFSSYFRRMVSQYCKKPIYERELIIFKDNYQKLKDSIESKQELLFTTIWNKNKIHDIIPFEICVGQDESHNYLLCAEISKDDVQTVKTYRLNRISSIRVSPKATQIEPTVIENLKRSKKFGSQHEINSNDPILVKLTDRGMRAYNRIYTDRPKYDKLDCPADGKCNMHFSCSEDQVFFYFRRFEKDDAEIISPVHLRNRMIRFHESVLSNYRNFCFSGAGMLRSLL